MTDTKNIYESEIEVCCHRVSFWYDLDEHELTDELQEALDEEAVDRAENMIVEGCGSGELNCLYVFPDGKDEEIRGWWEIKRD